MLWRDDAHQVVTVWLHHRPGYRYNTTSVTADLHILLHEMEGMLIFYYWLKHRKMFYTAFWTLLFISVNI